MNELESAQHLGRSLEALNELIRQQTEALEKWIRPHVIVDVYPRWFVNMLYFRVRNVGQTPAYNIRVTIDPPIPIRHRTSSDLNLFQHPISVIGPHEEISFFFDSAIELFRREDAVLQFDVKLEYMGPDGEEYENLIAVNIDLLRDLSIELPADDKIVERLERLQKEVETVARYVDRLHQRELLQAHLESQQQMMGTPEQEDQEGDAED